MIAFTKISSTNKTLPYSVNSRVIRYFNLKFSKLIKCRNNIMFLCYNRHINFEDREKDEEMVYVMIKITEGEHNANQ